MADTPYFMTGALGCIGAWVVKALVERGDVPVVFDTVPTTPAADAPAGRRRRWARCGSCAAMSPTAPRRACGARQSGARASHPPGGAAGADLPRQSAARRARQRRRHAQRLRGRPCRSACARVVYASSAAVFGLADEAVDETVTPEPLTHYGVFKQANEGNARVYFRDHGVSSVGLRPFSVLRRRPRCGHHERSRRAP